MSFFPWKSACFNDFPSENPPFSNFFPKKNTAAGGLADCPSTWSSLKSTLSRPISLKTWSVLFQKSFPWWWIENNINKNMIFISVDIPLIFSLFVFCFVIHWTNKHGFIIGIQPWNVNRRLMGYYWISSGIIKHGLIWEKWGKWFVYVRMNDKHTNCHCDNWLVKS